MIRIGIIGTSYWVEGFYLYSLKEDPNASVVSICGQNPEHTKQLAAKHGVSHFYNDYKAMLNDTNLDAVIIVTTEDLHYPMVMHSLNLGLHILCEKPMAMNKSQAKNMLELAKKRKIKNMIMFTNRWFPHYQYVRSLIDDGFLGEFHHGQFQLLTGENDTKYSWKYDPKRSNGIMSGAGSHLIDLAHWYIDDIERVHASLKSYIKWNIGDDKATIGANDSVSISVDFNNGGHGNFYISSAIIDGDCLHNSGIKINLYGSKGTIEISGNAGTSPPTAEIRALKKGDNKAKILNVPPSFWGKANRDEPFSVFQKNICGPGYLLIP